MKKHTGFTLIELMIVVAIIGIMSAIAYPSYTSYMKKSARADAKVGLAKLADKQERYYLQNNTYTTSFASTGLNTSSVSQEGYYNFTITSADPVSGFLLTATAVAGKSQANDAGCDVLTLSSTGVKTPGDCW
ncbi:MAG: type IV pilin protein [Gammaproteobacteria bacterium]|nr:type IV pilin protein [Gammaproteobacteria bacterium]